MLKLDPKSLSPDPVYGHQLPVDPDGWARIDLFPVELCDAMGVNKEAWSELDRFSPANALAVEGQNGRADLLLDFGAEIEAELELEIDAPNGMNIYATFGESQAEAAGLGGYGQGEWCQVRHWHIAETGAQRHRFPATGFRFVRLQAHDLNETAELRSVVAHATFVGAAQIGDLLCEEKHFQRLWQTSAYTARACTRPDDLWDGIKRDRLGWYGDARITALTYSAIFFDPMPAAAMLMKLPTEDWVNGIPNFSFDAVAIFRDLLLTHGLDIPFRDDNLARIRAMLKWTAKTQTNDDGFIIKTATDLQFGYGFLDWSALPVGGRLEELSWLQMKYLEALRNAAQIARWLSDERAAEEYTAQADALAARIVERFWDADCGFHHSLRCVRPDYEKYEPGWGEVSYEPDADFGPSGPSRHATACAVFSGLATGDRRELMLKQLDEVEQPPVITPMFLYYEQEARAQLGDPAGALRRMADYLRAMVEPNDAATIWESFEPEVTDFRKWGLHAWPKSLCHGWGSGLVPLTQRWMLGLENLGPGWSRLRIHPTARPQAFSATVPTSFGVIKAECGGDRVHYQMPDGIEVEDCR